MLQSKRKQGPTSPSDSGSRFNASQIEEKRTGRSDPQWKSVSFVARHCSSGGMSFTAAVLPETTRHEFLHVLHRLCSWSLKAEKQTRRTPNPSAQVDPREFWPFVVKLQLKRNPSLGGAGLQWFHLRSSESFEKNKTRGLELDFNADPFDLKGSQKCNWTQAPEMPDPAMKFKSLQQAKHESCCTGKCQRVSIRGARAL